jgi:hypothetical protein
MKLTLVILFFIALQAILSLFIQEYSMFAMSLVALIAWTRIWFYEKKENESATEVHSN